MSVVTLTDYTPASRADGNPWTQARLEESASPAGLWTLIETFTLDPVDSDPENPTSRSFTSELATIDEGWYRIVWVDADLGESATPSVQNIASVRGYRPLVSEVAELIRQRTSDVNSNEVGTFTADTKPTYEQANRVIDSAIEKLEARFGPSVPTELIGSARQVVALRAAMLIELSYFGNQIRADRSLYNELNALYTQGLADFLLERKELGADQIPGTADDQGASGLAVTLGGDCDSWAGVQW